MKSILVLIFCLLFGAAISAQTVDPPAKSDTANAVVEEAFLAKDDGSGKAGDPVASFFTTDIPIYCVVQLSSPKPATVKMNFVAVAVTGVKPETKVVTTVYTTKDGENRVNFRGKPFDKWNAGKYRVDIFVDGKIAKNLTFDIRPASGVLDGASGFQPRLRPKTAVRPKHE